MPRLIDADALLMDNTWAFYDRFGNRTSAGLAIEEAPTVDAEPVRHGRWEYNSAEYAMGIPHYECSICGETVAEKTNYCPFCGAKMQE